ncbi:hypothetical protein [Brucella intermedia]|uniref:hypothetical protein n=1 Tax=Brucella intermedia TaxID=94625 RepID=UPI00124D62EB|nr:hypothetical protein [Brucella intermedia]KAB2730441.1 hypothetical protein F9L02_10200 [Brucella intermedia]
MAGVALPPGALQKDRRDHSLICSVILGPDMRVSLALGRKDPFWIKKQYWHARINGRAANAVFSMNYSIYNERRLFILESRRNFSHGY